MSAANGKRMPINTRNKDSPNHMPYVTPDMQDDVIRFICDSWNKVYQEYQKDNSAVKFHNEPDTCLLPEGFKPFNLDAYLGKRPVQNLSSPNVAAQNS